MRSIYEKIDARKIIEDQLAATIGLDRYARIMHTVNIVNVSEDADFQRQFNGYYLVRRNAVWRKEYYWLFEMMKTETADFNKIITALFERTGNVEASFSSKMLATLYAGKPIWDHNVLRTLGLKLTGKSKREQLENAVILYSDIEKWYASYVCTDNAKECIVIFDRALPEYTWLSEAKKIDFFLW